MSQLSAWCSCGQKRHLVIKAGAAFDGMVTVRRHARPMKIQFDQNGTNFGCCVDGPRAQDGLFRVADPARLAAWDGWGMRGIVVEIDPADEVSFEVDQPVALP
jgi:hypothetical protein